MKPSELPKNKRDSVRINEEIAAALKEKGLSPQKLLDRALDEFFKIELNLEAKSGES